MAGLLVPTYPRAKISATAAVEESSLPRVSIIVAFYRESAATFQRCADGLAALDYPSELLDVVWVIARADPDAAGHARDAMARAGATTWRVLEADSVSPRAVALNAGLAVARGEIVGLLDADAVPEALQVRKAVAALQSGRWDAVESPQFAELGPGRWLAGLIRAEEAAWFASMQWMDWLAGTHMLAGSSIYFSRKIYDAVGPFAGPWGEEPVDWSFRFANLGFRAGVLDSISRGMPFRNPWAGLLQRRRWLKGQTECCMRGIRSLSRGRAFLLAAIVMASNLAVLLVLPAVLFSPLSRAAAIVVAAIVGFELLRIAVTFAGRGEWCESVPKRGWLLLLPWELTASIGYWLGLIDLCTGRKAWDQARD